jgi:ferredoxin-type protein NapH
MKNDMTCGNIDSSRKSLMNAVLLSLPMMLLTLLMLTRGTMPASTVGLFAFIVTYFLVNGLFFMMLYTGKTDRYRSALFISFSFCFVISFISHLIELRGSMTLSEATIIEGGAPFCHIVIPMTLIPAAFTKTIIFPGAIIGAFASIASMFVLWIGASLALGRGFCSWACFFGGLDEGFSRVARKPFIRAINAKWAYFPYAVLLAVVLTAASTLSPTYCEWLCPFKTVTEFAEITSVKILIQTVIFVSLFIALVVVLPLLTKRRTQCGLFCPFGAFQSFTNKINVFDIKIDPGKCIHCNQCVKVCPTFSMTETNVETGKSGLSCTKCGKCVDSCPQQAVFFHLKGASLTGNHDRYRLFAIYPAFLFLVTMAGQSVQDAIIRMIKLVSSGSMLG